MECVQLETEIAAQDFVAQKAGFTRFFQRFFETIIYFENFAVNIVVAHAATHGVSRNSHTFNDNMWVKAKDIAVFERTRFAFV